MRKHKLSPIEGKEREHEKKKPARLFSEAVDSDKTGVVINQNEIQRLYEEPMGYALKKRLRKLPRFMPFEDNLNLRQHPRPTQSHPRPAQGLH